MGNPEVYFAYLMELGQAESANCLGCRGVGSMCVVATILEVMDRLTPELNANVVQYYPHTSTPIQQCTLGVQEQSGCAAFVSSEGELVLEKIMESPW